MFPQVTRNATSPIFQAGHEGSIPFARSLTNPQVGGLSICTCGPSQLWQTTLSCPGGPLRAGYWKTTTCPARAGGRPSPLCRTICDTIRLCLRRSASVSILKPCRHSPSSRPLESVGPRRSVARSLIAQPVCRNAPPWQPRSPRLRPTRMTGARCSRSPTSWRACVLRGDIHEFRPARGTGHEQHGQRYGVIVQANELLPRSVVLVAPTSHSARPASFRPEIDLLGQTTRVLAEQVGAIDASRLGDLVGHVTPAKKWGTDEALLTFLGLR